MRNPMSMTSDEIHAEILSVRKQLSQQVRRLHDLAVVLARRARREGDRDTLRFDVAYANSWIRLGAAFERGLERASISDRLVRRKQEHREQQERSRQPAPASIARTTVANPVEDFEAVYGDVIDA